MPFEEQDLNYNGESGFLSAMKFQGLYDLVKSKIVNRYSLFTRSLSMESYLNISTSAIVNSS